MYTTYEHGNEHTKARTHTRTHVLATCICAELDGYTRTHTLVTIHKYAHAQTLSLARVSINSILVSIQISVISYIFQLLRHSITR